MKTFYLTGSIIFTVLVLILAFGNVSAQCSNIYFFFFPVQMNVAVISLVIAVLGIITGFFYHGFIGKIIETEDEEENDEF